MELGADSSTSTLLQRRHSTGGVPAAPGAARPAFQHGGRPYGSAEHDFSRLATVYSGQVATAAALAARQEPKDVSPQSPAAASADALHGTVEPTIADEELDSAAGISQLNGPPSHNSAATADAAQIREGSYFADTAGGNDVVAGSVAAAIATTAGKHGGGNSVWQTPQRLPFRMTSLLRSSFRQRGSGVLTTPSGMASDLRQASGPTISTNKLFATSWLVVHVKQFYCPLLIVASHTNCMALTSAATFMYANTASAS